MLRTKGKNDSPQDRAILRVHGAARNGGAALWWPGAKHLRDSAQGDAGPWLSLIVSVERIISDFWLVASQNSERWDFV